MKVFITVVVINFALIAGCVSSENMNNKKETKDHSFRLVDRQIKVTGYDPVSGAMVAVKDYSEQEVYPVIAIIKAVEITEPGTSGLSGSIVVDLVIQRAPQDSPYSSKEVIEITGGLDGTLEWISKGKEAEIMFHKNSNQFVDICPVKQD
jgi:maleate cis-trans isomerase